MSNHAPKIDPVSKLFFLVSLIAILLVVGILVNSLINTYKSNSLKGEVDSTHLVAAVSDNLKPIGFSATSDAPAAGAAGRGGKEIYDAVCASCHTTGVLDAPKLGDKAAWEARTSNGLAGLIETATNGKGSMPAKGGDPSLTDSELKAVVLYMTKESGLDLGVVESKAAIEKKDVATTSETKEKVEVVEKKADPVEPKTPDTPKEPEVPATPVVAAAPILEKAVEAPATPSVDGKKVYDTSCFACHASGVAGSPKLGDKEAWAPRISAGVDTMYKTALNGKGAMPPKGGNLSLPDADVKAAVDYMLGTVK